MPVAQLSVEGLIDILREVAGDADDVGPETTADVEFLALGYDSLALMETAAVVERRFGVKLDEERVVSAATPRELLDVVNEGVPAASAT
jgi:act minimal PKS acyl carrier protein